MPSGAPAYAHPASGSFGKLEGNMGGVEGMVGVCVFWLASSWKLCSSANVVSFWGLQQTKLSAREVHSTLKLRNFAKGETVGTLAASFEQPGPPRWNSVEQADCVKTLRSVLVSNHLGYLYIEAGWIGRWLVEHASKLAENQLAWLRYSSPSGGAAAGVALLKPVEQWFHLGWLTGNLLLYVG